MTARRILQSLVFCCGAALPSFACAQGWQRERAEVYQTFPEEPLYRAFLPPAADLSARFPKPGNQGPQGSCTAWAVGYALRTYYEGLVQGWNLDAAAHVVSPASIYNKLTRDRAACKDGASISDAMKLLRRDGAVDLASLPYSPATCSDVAAGVGSAPRDQWRIADWRRVNMTRLDNVKGEIVRGNPVVFGLDYSKSLLALGAASIYDDTDSPRQGGHAMVAVGYDDARQAFKVMNSWGAGWADNGFGWISYRAMQTLSDRGFVMSVAATPAPPPAVVENPPEVQPPIVTSALLPSSPPTLDRLPPFVIAGEVPSPPTVRPLPMPEIKPLLPTVIALAPPEPEVTVTALQSPVRPVEPPPLLPLPPAPQPPRPKPVVVENPQIRLARVIADLQCARVDVARVRDKIVRVTGFVPSADDRARISEALGKDGVRMAAGLAIYPWPQCEALLTFAAALTKADGLAVQAVNAHPTFRDGESMTVEVTTPEFPSYLYVTYLQTSGDAVHLAQPVGLAPTRYPPKTVVRLGGGGEQPTFRIGPPFGHEMIVVIATASPLFAAPRPPSEIERDYLTAFRLAFLEKPKPGMPHRIVAAAVRTLSTELRDTP